MMIEVSLLDSVYVTVGILFTLSFLSCLCCICMKLSDLKMKCYIMDLAKRKGLKVDMDKLESTRPKCQSPHASENCTIIVPDVAIIL